MPLPEGMWQAYLPVRLAVQLVDVAKAVRYHQSDAQDEQNLDVG